MMQHADFPDLRQGLPWSETSAHQWRNVVDAVRAMSALEVGHGLQLAKAADSWQLNLAAGKPATPQTFRKAVVLVEVPPDGGADRDRPWLLVREVEYATAARTVEPPDDPDHPYRWRGVPFQAYPQIGHRPAEYFDALWDDAGPPTLDATFLAATFDGRAWILELMGTPSAVVAQFRFVGFGGDFLLGRVFDGVNVGAEDVKIAKPYLLRNSTFNFRTREGVTYRAVGTHQRIATKVGTSPPEREIQVIVEPYLEDDLIYATAHVKGGVDVSSDGVPLLWVDDNRDGRAWAAEFEEEVASG